MRKIAMLASAVAFASAPHLASAAELGGSLKDVPPPVVIIGWTGFYAGVGVGVGATVDSYKFADEATWAVDNVTTYWHDNRTAGASGALGTVQLGYDYLFPASRLLIGAFADYDLESFSSSRSVSGQNKACPVTNIVCTDNHHTKIALDGQWNVGGRFGFLTSPETMLYVVVAYTQAQKKASLDNWVDSEQITWRDLNGSVTLDGVTFGAGMETHLGDNWFLKLEYRFSQLGSDAAWERVFGVRTNTLSERIWAEVDSDIHTARLVLAYKLARQGEITPLNAPAGFKGGMKDAPPPVTVTNWTGYYWGIGVGAGAVIFDYGFNDEANRVNRTTSFWHDFWSAGADGMLGTVQLGYDHQLYGGRWLIGAFVDYDWSHRGAIRDSATFDGVVIDTHHTGLTVEEQWNIGGRLGILTSPETLFYGLVAFTQSYQKASLDNWIDCEPEIWRDLSGSAALNGVTFGAGMETHLKYNWFLKLEYRYSQFDSDTAWDREAGPRVNTASEHLWADLGADIHTARLSLVNKFTYQDLRELLK